MDWKYILTSFQGRINRQPYWLAAIAMGIVFGILFYVIMAAFGSITPSADPAVPASMSFSPIGWVLMAILYIALIWVSLAVQVKRWHDRDKSGWWVIASLIPIVNIWAFIVTGFLRGTPGPNSYGEDPLAGR